MKKVAVVGAGACGLMIAYLMKGTRDVTVYEKTKVGGLAGTIDLGAGKHIEKFYHHFFTSDEALISLFENLGLAEDVKGHKAKMGFFMEEGFHDFSTPLDILRFKPLSLYEKAMFGLTTIYLILTKKWKSLEGMTCARFYERWHCLKVYEKIWKPLLIAKFGDMHLNTPMSWLWGRISARGKSRKGKDELLLYPTDSFKSLFGKMVQSIGEGNIKHHRVDSIVASEKGLLIGDDLYDEVIFTPSSKELKRCLGDRDEQYFRDLGLIDYQGVVCALFVLKKRLSDYYWLNVVSDDLPFSGLIEHTNFISAENYCGRHLVYAFNYVHRSKEFYGLSDEEIASKYKKGIVDMFSHITEDDITEAFVSKEPYANAIYSLGYSELMPAFQTPIKGLYFCNISQIYPEDRNVSNSIDLAKRLVQMLD